MRVAELIESHRDRLTPAERRVADVVLSAPEEVAFGTVAELAGRAATSGASVVRLATKLGLDGFVALQASVQDDLAARLRPAVDRIRRPASADPLVRAAAAETANVATTLEGVDRAAYAATVRALADEARRVWVLSSDASAGVAHQFADNLSMLRGEVTMLGGPPPRLVRQIAGVERGDTVVAIDLRRYERWVLDAAGQMVERGARLVALTDSRLSPLADLATVTLVVRAEGVGPFDSYVGVLALLNTLAAAAADGLRAGATSRLDRVEAAWRAADALTDD